LRWSRDFAPLDARLESVRRRLEAMPAVVVTPAQTSSSRQRSHPHRCCRPGQHQLIRDNCRIRARCRARNRSSRPPARRR
jgi:hypothetical protein